MFVIYMYDHDNSLNNKANCYLFDFMTYKCTDSEPKVIYVFQRCERTNLTQRR